MLSRPMVNALLVMKSTSLSHDSYVDQYGKDYDLKEVYDALTKGIRNGVEYNLCNNILCNLSKICIPKDERVNVI